MRRAVPADAPALVALLEALGYPGAGAIIEHRLAEHLSDDRAQVLVADSEEGVVGFVAFNFIPQLGLAGDFCRIGYLCVDERQRDRGVGAALVAAVEAEACRQGCDRLELHCDERRTAAHRFYERLGYSHAPRYYRKPLS